MSLDKYVQSCNYYHNQDFSVSILNYTVYLQVIFFHFTVWYPSLYTMLMVVIHFGLIYDTHKSKSKYVLDVLKSREKMKISLHWNCLPGSLAAKLQSP